MATRKIKDAKDLSTNELIYFRGHAKATFMSDGSTVEDAIKNNSAKLEWSILEEKEDDPFNGYEYVDLGLPSGTLWAKCNIGAENETDYGLYFAWGEVVGYNSSQVGYGDNQRPFEGSDYKWNKGEWQCDGSSFIKYTSSDNLTTLLPEDDAASVNMGGDWHMPSKEQCEELINSSYTTTSWITKNGINGGLIISKINGNTLFLPASGYFGWGSADNMGSFGYYWSSSLCEGFSTSNAWDFHVYSSGFYVGNGTRFMGFAVRGVVG